MNVSEKDWFFLYRLSKIGALDGISKNTTEIAEELSSSQQTVSRRIKTLKESGLLINIIQEDVVMLQISKEGKLALNTVMHDLKHLLKEKPKNHYYGHVQTGLGEGRFYIELPEYNIQFTNLLKKPPFPGTLNILLETENQEDFYYTLSQLNFHTVHGFISDTRTYGDVKCYKIRLRSNGNPKDEIESLLVDIHRTSHKKGTIEIVSPLNLREDLHLVDEDIVRIEFC